MAPLARMLVGLALLGGLPACTGAEEQAATTAPVAGTDATGPVLAEVGGIRITSSEFEAAAARKVPADGVALSVEERKEILDELVVEKILYLEAKKRGIDQDPKVQKVMVNTLLRQDVYAQVRNSDFTTEELRAYYDAHQEEFVVPEKVQIRRIFIKGEPTRSAGDAEALAHKLWEQVVADPAAFRDIATDFSEDPFRRRGGDLGYLEAEGKAGIEPVIVEKGFAMQVGDVSDPFEAAGGWNILMVSGRRDRIERSFEQMKGSVLRKVKNDRYKELYADYVGGIRGDYAVNIDEAVLSAVDVKPARRLSLTPGGGEPALIEDGMEGDLLEDLPD